MDLQVIVEARSVDLVEQVVFGILLLLGVTFQHHHLLERLKYKGQHLDGMEETHGVLTQEIKCDFIVVVFRKGHVLDPEGAAADSVGFVLTLLISNSEGQLVDKVGGYPKLLLFSVVGLHAFDVILSHLFDDVLQPPCAFVLLLVVLPFDLRIC